MKNIILKTVLVSVLLTLSSSAHSQDCECYEDYTLLPDCLTEVESRACKMIKSELATDMAEYFKGLQVKELIALENITTNFLDNEKLQIPEFNPLGTLSKFGVKTLIEKFSKQLPAGIGLAFDIAVDMYDEYEEYQSKLKDFERIRDKKQLLSEIEKLKNEIVNSPVRTKDVGMSLWEKWKALPDDSDKTLILGKIGKLNNELWEKLKAIPVQEVQLNYYLSLFQQNQNNEINAYIEVAMDYTKSGLYYSEKDLPKIDFNRPYDVDIALKIEGQKSGDHIKKMQDAINKIILSGKTKYMSVLELDLPKVAKLEFLKWENDHNIPVTILSTVHIDDIRINSCNIKETHKDYVLELQKRFSSSLQEPYDNIYNQRAQYKTFAKRTRR